MQCERRRSVRASAWPQTSSWGLLTGLLPPAGRPIWCARVPEHQHRAARRTLEVVEVIEVAPQRRKCRWLL